MRWQLQQQQQWEWAQEGWLKQMQMQVPRPMTMPRWFRVRAVLLEVGWW
jgi:hypothetical protein